MNEQVQAVQRMQDYLEEHVEDEVTLEDLAAVSLFSPWHSYRLFRRLTGMTPADYQRRMRLTHSAARLRVEGRRVADVAFESCPPLRTRRDSCWCRRSRSRRAAWC